MNELVNQGLMYKMPFNLKLNNHLTSLPFSELSLFVLLQDTTAGHEGRRPQGHMVHGDPALDRRADANADAAALR